jgi:hypothetical protein
LVQNAGAALAFIALHGLEHVSKVIRQKYREAVARQRTGLLLPIMTPVIGGAGYHCLPSPLLARIAELASFEDALRQEPPGA